MNSKVYIINLEGESGAEGLTVGYRRDTGSTSTSGGTRAGADSGGTSKTGKWRDKLSNLKDSLSGLKDKFGDLKDKYGKKDEFTAPSPYTGDDSAPKAFYQKPMFWVGTAAFVVIGVIAWKRFA